MYHTTDGLPGSRAGTLVIPEGIASLQALLDDIKRAQAWPASAQEPVLGTQRFLRRAQLGKPDAAQASANGSPRQSSRHPIPRNH